MKPDTKDRFRLKWNLRFALISVFLFQFTWTAAQITVNMQLPPPGRFVPEDFIHSISFQNHTGQLMQVYLTATVEEQAAGLVFSGSSAIFELLPGFSSPHYSVYDPVNTDFINASIESYILKTNTLPPGEYVVCIWVRDANTGSELGKSCLPWHVFHPSPPQLVYPSENGTISEPQPVFVWLAPAPLPATEVVYTVTITELLPGQSVYEAMSSNPVFLKEGGISGTTWLYGMHYTPMESGKQYVWQVQAHTLEGLPVGQNNGFSEVGHFTAGTSVERSVVPVSPMGACTGEVTSLVMAQSASFNWLATGAFTTFSVIVYENPCGRYPTPPRGPDYPTQPRQPRPPTAPTKPGQPTSPGSKPTSPDSVGVVPVDTAGTKPGTVVTTPWKPDRADDPPTTLPSDTGKITDHEWPEDDGDHDYRPPLPPGWAWGPSGCYWTGEHPPTPPDLPPGWEWGPLRPYWAGEGTAPQQNLETATLRPIQEPSGTTEPIIQPPDETMVVTINENRFHPIPELPEGWEYSLPMPEWSGQGAAPPERNILYVSQTLEVFDNNPLDPINVHQEIMFEEIIPLHHILAPGQAFIYQIYATYQTPDGSMEGYLSEPQCARYSATVSGTDTAAPTSCEVCASRIEARPGPKMNGGLDPPKDTLEIYRDDFVVLKAEGADFDEIWWFCTPAPDCPETPSTDMRVTSSRVKFTWEITDGDGYFTEVGCSGRTRSTLGDRVIFIPPYVKMDSLSTTKVKLCIIDDNASQPLDKTVERTITIKTERSREEPQKYKVTIDSDEYQLPQPTQVTGLARGTCRTGGPLWKKDQSLTTPKIRLPGEKDSDKLVFKELIRLYADDIRDLDNITVWCHSTQCDTTVINRDYEDEVEFTWSITKGGGRFIKGNKGRFVVYEAADKVGDVEIMVTVSNPGFLKIPDQRPSAGKVTLKVFQPGVRMDITPLSWLPKADSTRLLEKRSYLVYQKDGKWVNAMDHQCRIHLVQLLDISNEPGICLNWPYDSAQAGMFIDTCPDMTLKISSRYELYDSVTCKRWGCNGSETWFMEAGSKRPSKELKVRVMIWDYGGYGFIRSTANSDGDLKTPYESIGWTRDDYSHPILGSKNREYADNRVSIPMDADENRIADCGYYATTYSKVFNSNPSIERFIKRNYIKDERRPDGDVDNKPAIPTTGDGISNYEEYRGFMAKGKHQRLDPNQINLFVYDHSGLGTGSFGNSGVRLVLVDQYELEQRTRVINRNRKTHQLGFDQLGTILWVNPSIPANGPGGYAWIGLVKCDTVHINQWVVDAGQKWVDYMVAHELSHAVGAHHHGEGNIDGWLQRGDTVKINGKDSVNTTEDYIWFRIMLEHGVSSGDPRCWMRYNNITQYCFAPGEAPTLPILTPMYGASNHEVNLKNKKIITKPDNVIGTRITNQTTGTGVNRSGKCGGNAAPGYGKCLNQIKINQKP